MSPLMLSFTFKAILVILDHSYFHMNFRVNFSISVKKASCAFDRDGIESADQHYVKYIRKWMRLKTEKLVHRLGLK